MLDQKSQDKIWNHFQGNAQWTFDLSCTRLSYLANKCQEGEKVLNIGVGSGALEKKLLRNGVEVFSLDPSNETMERLRGELALTDSSLKQGYSESIPFEDNFFDRVIMTEVLEHLPSEVYIATLVEVKRVLKPGGCFLGTVPYQEILKSSEVICPNCDCIFHRWGHHISFTKESLREDLRVNGFLVKKIYPRTFPDYKRKGVKNLLKSIFRDVLGRIGEQIVGPHLFFYALKK